SAATTRWSGVAWRRQMDAVVRRGRRVCAEFAEGSAGVATGMRVALPAHVVAYLQAGEILLGKYRVERILGQGGMGMVVAARHIELGELFAIKLMVLAALEHREAVERF